MKKIVAVKFDDGTVMTVADVETLKRFVDQEVSRQRLREMAADTSIDWPTVAIQAEQRQTVKLKNRATKRINATGPNKHAAKESASQRLETSLREYCYKFESDNGFLKGWKRAACRDLGITLHHLNKIWNK